jgi:hypothetical protein
MVNEREDGEKRSKFLTFFTTLPGLLTAIAAVLSAVTGLVVVINQLDQGGSGSTKAGVVGLPDSVGPSALIYRTGELTVHSGDGVNLDAGVAGNGVSSVASGMDWRFPVPSNPDWRLQTGIGASFAPLDGFTVASRGACQTALDSRRDDTYVVTPLSVNHWVCVSTTGDEMDRIAAFRLDRVSSSPVELTVTFVVWRSP